MSEENRIKAFKRKDLRKDLPDEFSSQGRESFLRARRKAKRIVFLIILIIVFCISSLLWINLYLPKKIQAEVENSFHEALQPFLKTDYVDAVIQGGTWDILRLKSESVDIQFGVKGAENSEALVSSLLATWADPNMLGIIKSGQAGSATFPPDRLIFRWDADSFTRYFADSLLKNLSFENIEAVEITSTGIAIRGQLLVLGKERSAQMVFVPEIKDDNLAFNLINFTAGEIQFPTFEGKPDVNQELYVPGTSWSMIQVQNIMLEEGYLNIEAVPLKY